MKKTFKPISEVRICRPGEIYIFCESDDPGWDPGPIEFMYIIRSDDEIIPALKMDVEGYLSYQIKRFVGCAKISDSCFELKMECYDPEEGDIKYSVFLHRIKTLQDAIREACEEYGLSIGSYGNQGSL
jgi:hypothetical protein